MNFYGKFWILTKEKYICSPVPLFMGKEFGVWRSWLAHLVWDQRVLCSSHSTPTINESNKKANEVH